MKDLKKYLQKMTKMVKKIRSKKFPYCCFEEFVLKNGREYTNGNPVKVRCGRMGECVRNAFYFAEDNDLIYVEGYATFKLTMFPHLHAWCVDKDGKVYDPTWKDGVEYYGVPFDMAYVRKTILQKKTFGVIDNWEEGFPLLAGEDKDFLYKE